MKFRKRVKVFPGFHLNFSASGISSTIGPKGASFNISRRGTYSDKNRENNDSGPTPPATQRTGIVTEIKSAAISELSSTSLSELKELLTEVYNDKKELSKEISDTHISLTLSQMAHILSYLFIVGFFVETFKKSRDEKRDYLADLEQQLANTRIDIDLQFDGAFLKRYESVIETYKSLMTSHVIWDLTSSAPHDRKATRSAASHVVKRLPVKFKLNSIDIIRSSHEALHFENRNGGDLYIYPGFVIMTGKQQDFAMLDMKDLEVRLSQQHFVEEDKVPADATVIGKTWAKVNKNGTPDKRFKDNYEIPIVGYGQIDVSSATGLNEVYAVSNYQVAERFVSAFNDYQRLFKS